MTNELLSFQKPADANILHVTRLSNTATEDGVAALFQRYGALCRVKVKDSKSYGRFAFVEFFSRHSASLARKALANKMLDSVWWDCVGREVRVASRKGKGKSVPRGSGAGTGSGDGDGSGGNGTGSGSSGSNDDGTPGSGEAARAPPSTCACDELLAPHQCTAMANHFLGFDGWRCRVIQLPRLMRAPAVDYGGCFDDCAADGDVNIQGPGAPRRACVSSCFVNGESGRGGGGGLRHDGGGGGGFGEWELPCTPGPEVRRRKAAAAPAADEEDPELRSAARDALELAPAFSEAAWGQKERGAPLSFSECVACAALEVELKDGRTVTGCGVARLPLGAAASAAAAAARGAAGGNAARASAGAVDAAAATAGATDPGAIALSKKLALGAARQAAFQRLRLVVLDGRCRHVVIVPWEGPRCGPVVMSGFVPGGKGDGRAV
ncbi:unnamed protein product [Phaeothamnion confervicola]